MRSGLLSLSVVCLIGAFIPDGVARAQGAVVEPAPVELCAPSQPTLEPLRYLRALSLDLRGSGPTPDEIAAVTSEGAVSDDIIDGLLESPEFAEQAVRRHRALVWNRIDNVRLIAFAASFLARFGTPDDRLYGRLGMQFRYRGGEHWCLDEPARFDPATGEIIAEEVVQPDGSIARREGYVRVRPYWAPEREIKVCAFDAQEQAVSASGVDCSSRIGMTDPECGCGPNLRWCTGDDAFRETARSFGESLDRFMFDIFSRDASYIELFTSQRFFVNGPIVDFFRHRTTRGPGLVFEPLPFDRQSLPDQSFADRDEWHHIDLPAHSAGLLTHPAYLLRFQTNRARANRFYDAWLCQPFNPPDGGLPVVDEASARNPDLQLRAGCKYCHALLEPAASHWGRWTEQGTGYLYPDEFPRRRADCFLCGTQGRSCSAECRNFYVTRALSPEEEPFLGELQSYAFRRIDHEVNIQQGPRFMAFVGAADNRLPRCVARRTGEWLLGRAMDQDGDREWLETLAQGFVQSGYSYRWLVKRVVTDARYWRVR